MQIVRGGVLAAALCALALGASSGAYAQATTSTTTNVSNFEVISVDGNYLVVRDQAGTRELTVPSDFRFNVDGKSLAVGDLKAGMKGTATITKTTTVRPVVVTEIKKGKVLSQTGQVGRHRDRTTGKIHRFSQSEVDTRGIQLFMGDKPVRLFNLEPGDQISAKIVTAGPPEVLTQQQVDAILAQPAAPVAAAAAPAEEPAASTPEATAAPAAEPVAEAAPEVVAEAAPAPEPMAATEPVEEKSNLWLWILLLIVLAVVAWLVTRNKKRKRTEHRRTEPFAQPPRILGHSQSQDPGACYASAIPVTNFLLGG